MARPIDSNLAASPELAELLEKAKNHQMTPEEIREQRISWAYGNAAIENPNVTKDMVKEAHIKLHGY